MPMESRRKRESKAMQKPDAAIEFAQTHGARFVEELKDLLRIPSISTLPEHATDVRRAAQFVADVRLIETASPEHPGGHPLVYADWLNAGSDAVTVLCYGHYDVQPAEPLDEWKSPPFEPEERDGNLYARGAVDDKGQMWMHVKALESLFAANGGRLPVNVRVIVEGEEEVGGEGIARYVREHGD
jgi:acetylornithine deacetylase/succinyl-diaminopimelate desuccinylase-like protein